MRLHNPSRSGGHSARPVVAVLAALSIMGGGLAAGAQAADTLQTAAAPYSQINGGGGQPPVTA